MKNTLLFAFCLSISFALSAQNAQNITQLGAWDSDTLPTHFYGTFNDVWGYADNNGGEYAIMGSASYIHVINVTDPSNPTQVAAFAGGSQTVWRDFKTYRDRAYCVADNSGEGLIILNMSELPNAVSVVSQVDTVFSSSHNIFIDEAEGRLYVVAGDFGSDILIYDIATDPDNPAVLGMHDLPGGGIHDLYVRDNIVYAASEYDGYFIYDFTDVNNPISIASKVTNGYNHSTWVSEDGSYAIFAEEVPTGLPLGVMDLSDMMDNDLTDVYFQEMLIQVDSGETRNTPHNPYLIGDLMITSYYEDGIHIYNMADPFNPTLFGYFDTYPENTEYNGYAGCWGAYPYLPSGNLLASDMDHGLLVLQYDLPLSANDLPDNVSNFKIYPNPTVSDFTIEMTSDKVMDFDYQLHSITGQLVNEGQFQVNGQHKESIATNGLLSGMYLLTLQNGKQIFTQKISILK